MGMVLVVCFVSGKGSILFCVIEILFYSVRFKVMLEVVRKLLSLPG